MLSLLVEAEAWKIHSKKNIEMFLKNCMICRKTEVNKAAIADCKPIVRQLYCKEFRWFVLICKVLLES